MRFAPAALSALILALPATTWADTFEASAPIDHVTLYPDGADVMRRVTLSVPAGENTVVIPNIGALDDPSALRITASDGVTIGATRFSSSRLPVTGDHERPEVSAAKAEIERLEAILRDRDAEIALLGVAVTAAQTRLLVLNEAGSHLVGGTTDPASLSALVQAVGAEAQAAGEALEAARQAVNLANLAREDDAEALEKARQALAALQADGEIGVVEVTFAAATAGEVTLQLTSRVWGANWAPTYDIALTSGENPSLSLDRGVFIGQYTGEDWVDVSLTLSTARPGGQLAPNPAYGWNRRIMSEEEMQAFWSQDAEMAGLAAPMMEEAIVADAAPGRMQTLPRSIGATLVYDYGSRVTLRSDADALRLSLAQVELPVRAWAAATPASDQTAYRVAELENDSGELFLPGMATLILDGAVVGFGELPLTAPGATAELGFGPIDGLQVEVQHPSAREGDVGLISRSNQQESRTVYITRNLTGQDWDLTLTAGLSYADQEDLEITHTFSTEPTRVDPDGQRGIVEWDLTVGAGAVSEITVDEMLEWPTGYVLQ